MDGSKKQWTALHLDGWHCNEHSEKQIGNINEKDCKIEKDEQYNNCHANIIIKSNIKHVC